MISAHVIEERVRATDDGGWTGGLAKMIRAGRRAEAGRRTMKMQKGRERKGVNSGQWPVVSGQ